MVKVSLRDGSDCADIDSVILYITSAIVHKTRVEELAGTSKIVAMIIPDMMKHGFKGIFLIATNSCDTITYQVWKLSALPKHWLIATSVWLDTVRLRRVLGETMDIGLPSMEAFIVGEPAMPHFLSSPPPCVRYKP